MPGEVLKLQHAGLKQFLVANRAEGDVKPTNTRIGDKASIRGGKYAIDNDAESEFLHHYFAEVVQGGADEYLTEKQLGEGGPIVVDLDFRYDPDIKERQHNEVDLQDVVSIYLDALKTIFAFAAAATTEFMVYVFEKPEVNTSNDDVTKDGVHIIIGIQMSNLLQTVLRDKVLKHFETNPNNIDIISDLPLKDTCTWKTVFDEGISKGSVNWQLYGSKKPHNEAYRISSAYKITMDESDGEFCTEPMNVDVYHRDIEEFKKLSVRYRNHPKFDLTPDAESLLAVKTRSKKGGRVLSTVTGDSRLKVVSRAQIAPSVKNNGIDPSTLVPVDRICTKAQLDDWCAYIERTMDDSPKNYKKRDAHRYALVLPEMFYGDGSFNEWIRLGFALKNTDEMMFITWAVVSAKAKGFDYGSIGDLYDRWCKIDKKSDGQMLTCKSVMYWAKEHNRAGFEKVKCLSLDHYIVNALDNDNDREIAQVLFFLCNERFVCSGLSTNTQIWYEFEHHRWMLDRGMRLRKAGISEELYEVFYAKQVEMVGASQNTALDGDRNKYDKTGIYAKNASAIMSRCHSNSQKTHIAKEAAELFWDGEFGDKLDQDKWTLCYSNGVINLQTGEFRDGRPMDYISKTTGIPYIPESDMGRPEHQTTLKEITVFMSQLFPDESLREYVWEHLASTLIGANLNQTFNIYKGSGSNGKSLLTELMSICLGEYCNPTAPISIITSKRVTLGGTSSELYALKSIRYAVFQEPTKGMVLNEGAMKEMTGDAKIQARELYCTSSSFIQMFSLAVCTNSLFEIKSQDDGTWRRLRIINFSSCFKNDDEFDALPEKTRKGKYIFRKDVGLRDKLDDWAPVFSSLLVRRCIKNQGVVKDCPLVLAETNKYRLRQDLIGQFVAEKIKACEGRNITRQALSQTWKMWVEENQAANAPKMGELCEFLSSKYGKFGNAGWADVEIVYEAPTENDAF